MREIKFRAWDKEDNQNNTKKQFFVCKNLWAIWYLIKTPKSKLSLHNLIHYVYEKCFKDKK